MILQFNDICAFRQVNPGIKGSGIIVTDPNLIPVKKNLQDLKDLLKKKFENYRGFTFSFVSSQGQTYYPSILHICILPPNQLVSSGIYVAICFDIRGRGAVVGCAESVTVPQGLNTLTRKKRNVKLNIDVDGVSQTTKYNDSFENPKEFHVGIQSDSDLLKHIQISLDLALYHLGLGDSLDLRIEDKVVAEANNLEFFPTDIKDAREKIARQITARRGQKKFRNAVLKAYNRQCAFTGNNTQEVLEAAHILSYKGEQTNHVQNGILLRSDIHLLFDLGLLTIEAETYKIQVHSSLANSVYFEFNNTDITLPLNSSDYPNREALRHHNVNEFRK